MHCLSAQSDFIVQHRFLGVKDGLSNRTVHSLFRDDEGFLWIGTEEGLNRYDGYRFKVYNSSNSGFPFNHISHIYEDEDGWFWLTAPMQYGGMFLFHPETGEVKTLEQKFGNQLPFNDMDVTGIYPTSDGTIWFQLQPGLGLAWFERGKSLEFLTGQDAAYLECQADSQSVFVRQKGLLRILGKDKTFSEVPKEWAQSKFRHAGYSYVPYYTGFLSSLTERKLLSADSSTLLPDLELMPSGDSKNKTHVISKNLVLDNWALHHRSAGVLFNISSYLADGAKTILPLGENKIWIGGHNGILLLNVKPVRFSQLLGKGSFAPNLNNSCRGMWGDGNRLFIHFDELGLYEYDLTTKEATYIFSKGLWGHFGLTYYDNALYGGLQKGCYRYDLQTKKINHWPFDLTVLTLFRTKDDRWLCGTSKDGIQIFDEAKGSVRPFDKYNSFTELTGSEINFIGHDKRDRIWICADSGFYQLELQKGVTARYWSKGEGAYHFPADDYRHFHEDRDGLFWLATGDNGVILWNPRSGEVRKINHSDGLSSNDAYAVYEDQQGQFWIPTPSGINQIDKATMHLKFWTTQDGIEYDEFNKFSHFMDHRGKIYFGGLDGVTQFDPKNFDPVIHEDHEPFHISDLQIFNSRRQVWEDHLHVVLDRGPLQLYKGDNLIKIDFALLDLDQPADIRYSWQLNGLDSLWHAIDYPTLQVSRPPYGKYTLKIRAIPSQGIWRGEEYVLPIHVIAPFYLRPWAWLLGIVLLLTGIWQYGRWQAKKQKKRAQELEKEVLEQTSTIRKQAEELKQLDEMKSRFFANVSHELRTPLTLLLGPLGSVLKKNNLDSSDRSYVEMARENGQQLLRLVGEILDLGKLTSGTLIPEEKETKIVLLIKRLCGAFTSHAGRLGILYMYDIDAPDHCLLMLDEKKFTAIVNNLLSNAFKFTSNGGTVNFKFYLKGHQMMMVVEDDGKGIHPDDLPHVFDRYFQSTRTDVPLAGGTGIGLALCKEYAQLLGGNIEVQSPANHGKGTRFTVNLPAKMTSTNADTLEDTSVDSDEEAKESVDTSTIPGSDGKSIRILVVEDNEDLRAYISTLLAPMGSIIAAGNGKEALSCLSTLENGSLPSIIISDIMMPEMDGFQLAEALKQDDRYRQIPLVMLTARADIRDKLKALRIGVDDYLLKPFEEDELLARVYNLVRNSRARFGETDSIEDIETTPAFSQEDQQWLEELEQVVRKELVNFNLQADMLANQLSMSRTTLFRRIKSLTGLTPQQYITEVRYRVARESLESRKYSTVKSVAHSVGLRDVEHFSKQFRDRFGKLPSAYLN